MGKICTSHIKDHKTKAKIGGRVLVGGGVILGIVHMVQTCSGNLSSSMANIYILLFLFKNHSDGNFEKNHPIGYVVLF